MSTVFNHSTLSIDHTLYPGLEGAAALGHRVLLQQTGFLLDGFHQGGHGVVGNYIDT